MNGKGVRSRLYEATLLIINHYYTRLVILAILKSEICRDGSGKQTAQTIRIFFIA